MDCAQCVPLPTSSIVASTCNAFSSSKNCRREGKIAAGINYGAEAGGGCFCPAFACTGAVKLWGVPFCPVWEIGGHAHFLRSERCFRAVLGPVRASGVPGRFSGTFPSAKPVQFAGRTDNTGTGWAFDGVENRRSMSICLP